MVRKALIGTTLCGLCVSLLAQVPVHAAQDRVSATEKGSLLFFPKIEVKWENEPPYNVAQDAFVHVTNDYPGPSGVAFKMFFVNGDAPLECGFADGPEPKDASTRFSGGAGGGEGECDRDHPGWNYLDNVIDLTHDQPAYWSAASGLPTGVSPWSVLDPGPPPGRVDPNNASFRVLRGYIVGFAVDATTGNEIRWNHIGGDVTIVNYATEAAWQYNAYAFQADAGVAHGEETGSPGDLKMDGTEYAPGFAELLLNFIASGSLAYTSDGNRIKHGTDLTLLPIDNDFRQEGDGPIITKVTFDIWNYHEVKFTNLDRCVTCWDQELLGRHAIPNHFMVEALQSDSGKARMDGVASQLCVRDDGTPSVDASLLGVSTKLLGFGLRRATAGTNLIGMGVENGRVQYDTQGPPPEQNWNEDSINRFIDEMLTELGD